MPRGVKTQLPAREWENQRFLVSIGDLAKELEVHERTIRRYVQRGMPRRADGRFYLFEALQWYFWNAHTPYSFDKDPQPTPPQAHSYLEPIVDDDQLREMERALDNLMRCRDGGKALTIEISGRKTVQRF
ncbi:MAG: HTH domain-containing protein [Nitrospinae bacterium]|nr:HTH domain-containing protein [Nitrospinota bacterium]